MPTKKEAAEVVKQLLAEGHDLRNVPGFYRPDPDRDEWRMNVGDWHAGFIVNARDVDERVQGQQIRRAEVRELIDRETGRVKVGPKQESRNKRRASGLSSANRPATSKPRP